MTRTPITYYGGKQRLAPTIISMIPSHRIYCEPFFGGGAVFFSKRKSGIEVINDHDCNLINFYQCVQNNFDQLQELIQNTLHSEKMYLYAKDIFNERTEATEIEKAWAVWLITNGSFSGSMRGGWKWCNGSNGGNAAGYLKRKRSDFSNSLRDRLEDVQISCRDALKVISERDTPDTFYYLDPPYPLCNQAHYAGYTEEHLEKLLSLLLTIKGKYILSMYWNDTLRSYTEVHNINYVEFKMNLNVAKLGRKQETQYRTEVLIYNYDIYKNLFD